MKSFFFIDKKSDIRGLIIVDTRLNDVIDEANIIILDDYNYRIKHDDIKGEKIEKPFIPTEALLKAYNEFKS